MWARRCWTRRGSGAAGPTGWAVCSEIAKAYGRDAELYQFLKSMETLQGSLDDKTWLVLSTDSDLLQYLKSDGRPR